MPFRSCGVVTSTMDDSSSPSAMSQQLFTAPAASVASVAPSPLVAVAATPVLHIINGEHYAGAERVQDLLGQQLGNFGYRAGFACLKRGQFAAMRKCSDAPLLRRGHEEPLRPLARPATCPHHPRRGLPPDPLPHGPFGGRGLPGVADDGRSAGAPCPQPNHLRHDLPRSQLDQRTGRADRFAAGEGLDCGFRGRGRLCSLPGLRGLRGSQRRASAACRAGRATRPRPTGRWA